MSESTELPEPSESEETAPPGEAPTCYHCLHTLLDPDYCPRCHLRQSSVCEGCGTTFRRTHLRCPSCGKPRRRHRRAHKKRSVWQRLIRMPAPPQWRLPRIHSIGILKQCWRCHRWLPYTWYRRRNKRGEMVRTHSCRNCYIDGVRRLND